MLRVGVCDDDIRQMDLFVNRIKAYSQFSDAEIITATTGKKLLKKSQKSTLDFAFLDIQLENENGIELGLQLRNLNRDCIIVFVTGYRDYALDAYHVNPATYLLKPVGNEDLDNCMKLLKKRYDEKCALKDQEYELWFQMNRQRIKIKFSKIYYFEKSFRKIIIHTKEDTYEFYGSLKELKNMEGYHSFFEQCHQGFIINKKKIIEFANDAILLEGIEDHIPVSRRYKSVTKEVFESVLFA